MWLSAVWLARRGAGSRTLAGETKVRCDLPLFYSKRIRSAEVSPRKRETSQKGFTTARTTMPIMSTVGTSFQIRHCRAVSVFRSSPNRRTAAEKKP
jgi:hypothetical protein